MAPLRNTNALVALSCGVCVAACSPDVSGPEVGTTASSLAYALLEDGRSVEVRDVDGVTVDLPPEARPWDTSFVALRDTLVARGGGATVGFKSPGSPRMLAAAGYRAPVRSAQIRESLATLEASGVKVIEYLGAIGAAHVRINAAPGDTLLAWLANHPAVDYIEPDDGVDATSPPSFASASVPRRTESTDSMDWGVLMVRAPAAWPVTMGGGARVMIIDSGHEQGHPDLPNVPTANCFGPFGGCDDGAPSWHGTRMMGNLVGRQNGIGIVGVAPGVSGNDVYVWAACNDAGTCANENIQSGINEAIQLGIKVVSISLARPIHTGVANAVATAWSSGIIVVAAAGNSNQPSDWIYPAAYSQAVAVSGVKVDKTFATSSPCGISSKSGSYVDLSAPFWVYSTIGNAAYETACGTSEGTSLVAGAAALLRAQYPTWTASQVVNRLQNTSQDLGAFGKDNSFGHGLVDAALAFGIRQQGAYDDYPDANITGPTQVHPEGVCQWYGTSSQHGMRPYTYRWFRSSQLIGTGSPLVYIEPGWDNFYLDLEVTDAGGAVAWESRYIVINVQSNQCPH